MKSLFVKTTVKLATTSTQCLKIDYELIAAENFQRLYDYSLNFSKISILFKLWNEVIKKYKDTEGEYTNFLKTQFEKEDKYSAARSFHFKASDLKRKMLECFVKKSVGHYKKYLPWITGQEIKDLHAIQVRYYAIKSQKKHLLRIADVCSKVLQNQQEISTEQFKQSKESALSLLQRVLIEDAQFEIPKEANFNVLNVSIPITEDEARDFLAYPRINNHVPDGEWFAPDFRWTCIYAFEAECDLAGKTVRADQIEDVACLLRDRDSGVSSDTKAFVLHKLMASGKTAIVGVLTAICFKLFHLEDILIHMPPSFNFTVEILNYERGLKPFGISPLLVQYSRQLPAIVVGGKYKPENTHEKATLSLKRKLALTSASRDFFLVIAPETMLSLSNMRIMWESAEEKPSYLKDLKEVFDQFSTKGHVIIDELQLTAGHF